MPYSYAQEKPKLFSEEQQEKFLKARDWVRDALNASGAFTMGAFMTKGGIGGDSWLMMAMIDRLVELGEVRELNFGDCAGQSRTFVRG